MVCDRCVSIVSCGIRQLGIQFEEVSLGRLLLTSIPDEQELIDIETFLMLNGFGMVRSRNEAAVKQVKLKIHELFEEGCFTSYHEISKSLADDLQMSYGRISEIFSREEGSTIEHYMIIKRLEKVKHLLKFSDSSLTEIAYQTGFGSLHHLSSQFKHFSKISPTRFRAQLSASSRQLKNSVLRK